MSELSRRKARCASRVSFGALVAFAASLLFLSAEAFAQVRPPLEDFVALTSKDEKLAEAAAARLTPVWSDSYAAMVIDLARFFRPARPALQPGVPDDTLGGDDNPQTDSAPRGGREPALNPVARTPESIIRARLMRFLARQTKRSFGDDLKKWRKWSWSLAYDPHPE